MYIVSPSLDNISLLKLSHVDNVDIKHTGILPASDITQIVCVAVIVTSAQLLSSQDLNLPNGYQVEPPNLQVKEYHIIFRLFNYLILQAMFFFQIIFLYIY